MKQARRRSPYQRSLRLVSFILAASALSAWFWGVTWPQAQAQSAKLPSDLAEKAGQMIVVGFHGTNERSEGFAERLRELESGSIGGVLFLAHNIGSRYEIVGMTRALRACKCKHPPLIAIDEEGGRVERLTDRMGFASTPSAAAIAETGDEMYARRHYERLAAEVANAGFNLNLAPVVDLDEREDNPAIGGLQRSFSSRPGVVRAFARVFIESQRKFGVLTSLKHFPGHGSATGDTHQGFVDVTETWREIELEPYAMLLSDGLVDTVMVGHISSNQWLGLASLSPSDAISRLLRKGLAYDGVVLTDDLDMGAVELNSPDFSKTIERAIAAGNDVVVIGNRLKNRPRVGDLVHGIILDAVAAGRLYPEEIEASYRRIMRLKTRISR